MSITKGNVTITNPNNVKVVAINDDHSTGVLSLIAQIAKAQIDAGTIKLESVNSITQILQNATTDELDALAAMVSGKNPSGNIVGSVSVSGSYADILSTLRTRYPNLTINALKEYMRFADAEVERVLIANGIGDGGGITEDELAAVTSIGTWFQNNTNIKSFNELGKTGVTELKMNAFSGCTNLESIDLSKITAFYIYCLQNINWPKDSKFVITNDLTVCGDTCLNCNIQHYNCTLNDSGISITYSGVYYFAFFKNVIADYLSLRTGIYSDAADRLNFSVIDIGTVSSNLAYRFNYINCHRFIQNNKCILILRDTPRTIEKTFTWKTPVIFVDANYIDEYRSHEQWSAYTLYEIGGEYWQDRMLAIANEYGNHYNPNFDKDTADYSDAYIDYDIFGLDKPTE